MRINSHARDLEWDLEWDLILRFEGLRMGINSHGRDLEWDLSP